MNVIENAAFFLPWFHFYKIKWIKPDKLGLIIVEHTFFNVAWKKLQ